MSAAIVPRQLLVVRLSALGDVIHTLPAVVALRNALPETDIRWAVESPYRELVELVGGVTAIAASLKRWARTPLQSMGEFRAFRRALRGATSSIDFQGLVKSSAVAWLAGADLRYGFSARVIREKAALLFTNRRVEVDAHRHVVEMNMQLAEGVLGRPLPQPRVDFHAFVATTFAAERGTVVLLPGAGKPEKMWPVERFRELARLLGGRALVVWGPGEEERARAIEARISPRTNLRELAAVLSTASVVVGADTGPLHLAAALGTPVVGLYGPTNPNRNGPYGQIGRCVDRFTSTRTMESISVDDVMTKLREVGIA